MDTVAALASDNMAAAHDMHAPVCGDRQATCAEGEAQSEGNVRCREEPSKSCPTPHVLLALMRRAHLRQVVCCTVTSALCPNADAEHAFSPRKPILLLRPFQRADMCLWAVMTAYNSLTYPTR